MEEPNWPSLYAAYISEENDFPASVQWARKKQTEEMINKLTKGPESECDKERYPLNGYCLFLECPMVGDEQYLSLVKDKEGHRCAKLCGEFYYQSPDK